MNSQKKKTDMKIEMLDDGIKIGWKITSHNNNK